MSSPEPPPTSPRVETSTWSTPVARVIVVATVMVGLIGLAGCRGPSPSADGSSATPTTQTESTPPRSTRGSTSSTSARRAPGTTAPSGFSPAPIEWASCQPQGFECASVDVPLDYEDPGGRTISLGLIRQPARNDAERIGSLFFNPGGPGASGIESLPGIVGALSADVQDRFDLVAWDPRGVGASAPIACDEGILDLYKTDLDVVDPGPEVDRAAARAAELCQADAADLLPFVGTKDVARDLDTLRQAVGDEQVSYLGVSYGSFIGLVYAELFPTHIRAMILDGVVDPTLDPSAGNLRQSIAVDRALGSFIDWCAATSTCEIHDDPAGALDELQRKAKAGQVTGTIKGQRLALSPTLTTIGVVTATYDEARWPTLATAVRSALDGDGSRIARIANTYLTQASLGANSAVNCLDAPKPTDAEIDELAEQAAKQAPRAGVFNANAGRVCEFWPVPPKPVATTFDAAGAPPIMVWGTTGDNATPYENAVHVAGILPDARLVTLEGKRHAAIGANLCVERLQSDYLVGLALPAAGTTC